MANGEETYLEHYLSRRLLSAGMNKAKKGFIRHHKQGITFLLEVVGVVVCIALAVWTFSYMHSTPKCQRLGTCVVSEH